MNKDNACKQKNILFYSKGTAKDGRRFEKEVEQKFSDAFKDVCRTLEEFKQLLVDKMRRYHIVVLLCANHEELSFFSLMHDLISESRLILIVPDSHAETIRRAHQLYPRFLCYVDSNFEDVVAVIRRLESLELGAPTDEDAWQTGRDDRAGGSPL